MALDNEKNKWFKIGDVANHLNVGNHIIRHYTNKLEDVLGENVRVDPANKFTMYNSDAIKVLANVKKMVQDDHMTLNEVNQELLKVDQRNLPAKFEIDAAKSFIYIKNVIESQQEQIGKLINALGSLTGKLEGFDQLPSVIKAYHDDVNGVFGQLSRMEQSILSINNLTNKLDEYEKENTHLKQLFDELKDRADQTESVIKQELAESVKSILNDNEKRWSVLMLQEKSKESEKKKWWNFFS